MSSILQAFNIPEEASEIERIQHTITIPKKISKAYDWKDRNTIYINSTPSGFTLNPEKTQESDIKITMFKCRTRTYNGTDYYITKIRIPKKIITKNNFQKKDEFVFEILNNSIIAIKI
jgi:hypothetical protein